MNETFAALFGRDIDKLIAELEKYQLETNLWLTLPGTSNSGGNLALHLIGNLNTYIGNNLGGGSYMRNRPAEFANKNIARTHIIEQLQSCKAHITSTLQNMTPVQFTQIHPENVLGYEMTNAYFVSHLLAHLSYHMGQINYHRRVVEA
jgi:uncharacterized damage-inducible protein DinB